MAAVERQKLSVDDDDVDCLKIELLSAVLKCSNTKTLNKMLEILREAEKLINIKVVAIERAAEENAGQNLDDSSTTSG